MKKAVVELDVYSLKYDNVLSVARGLVESGIEVKMWNSSQSSILDMIYEIKPDLVFYHSEVHPRVISKINAEHPQLMLVDTVSYENAVVADTTSFKPTQPHPFFVCEEVCLVQYPEVENTDCMPFRERMSSAYRHQFRAFSIKEMSGSKNCGWLPKETHPAIFSSAKSVLCLSVNTAVNAFLCNKNVFVPDGDKVAQFAPSDELMNSVSNVVLAKEYIDKYAIQPV